MSPAWQALPRTVNWQGAPGQEAFERPCSHVEQKVESIPVPVQDGFGGCGGVPVLVTYRPLCSAAIVYERRLPDGETPQFGMTGLLRNSDMVMYDRQTQSWWQQYTGTGIAGKRTGVQLKPVPSRLESFGSFRTRTTNGEVLIPKDATLAVYWENPYRNYDSDAPGYKPFLFAGDVSKNIHPMEYVVHIGDRAWTLDLIREKRRIVDGDLEITWRPGMASPVQHPMVAGGRDLGQIAVKRDGENTNYSVTFSFVYFSFYPDGSIETRNGAVRF